jgi:hypothetical protein
MESTESPDSLDYADLRDAHSAPSTQDGVDIGITRRST